MPARPGTRDHWRPHCPTEPSSSSIAGAVRTADATARHALKLAEHQELSTDRLVARARLVVAWAAFYRLDFVTAEAELIRMESSLSTGVDAIVETYASLVARRSAVRVRTRRRGAPDAVNHS